MKWIIFLITFFTLTTINVFSQVYFHNFGTSNFTVKPYTVAPTTLNSNLSSSSWTTSAVEFTAYTGSSGRALSIANSSGTPTYTLTFNVNSGSQLSITSFNFWRQRSTTGAQNWSMSINGTNVGSGTIPETGSSIGVTNVSSPINNLTGTVTIILTLSNATGTGTFRLDDFTLNGGINNSSCSTVTSLSIPSTVGSTTTTGTQTTCGRVNDFPAGSFANASPGTSYGGGEDAVWEITVPSGGRNLQFDLGGGAAYKILSLHSSCTPSSSNVLSYGTTSTGTSTSFSRILNPGTYYLWVDTWPAPNCGEYSITITRLADPLPPNCVSSPTSPTNNQTNISLTPTLSWPSDLNATSYDIYFGNPLPESPTTNTSSTSYSPGTLLGSTTYYWKIIPKNTAGSATGCNTWSFTTLTPVANDDPSTATTLVVNDVLGYKLCTNVNSNSTTTESDPTCASYAGSDVWFKIVVPNGISTLEFDTQTGGITDGGMSIYRGNIGSLIQIECDDDDGLDGLMPWITRSDFIQGETIYIRFWEYGGNVQGTFKIYVSTPQPLPVELTQFEATPYPQWDVIKWTTASEHNSSHFDLEISEDGENWRVVCKKEAAGNSQTILKYSYINYNTLNGIFYYKLVQFDIDGKYKTYGPISIQRGITNKKIIKYMNILGQEVNPDTKGIIFEVYEDGTMRKIIR